MPETILFAEFKDDLLGLEEYLLGSVEVIAMQPCAQAYLSKNVVSYNNTLRYFGEEGHRSALNKSKEIMGLLRENFFLKDSFGVRHAYERAFFFHLRIYLHYWLVHLYIVNEAVAMHQPQKILSAPPSPLELISALIEKDRLLTHVVGAYSLAHKIDHEIVGSRKLSTKGWKFELPNWLKRVLFKVTLAAYKIKSKGKKVFLVPSDSYNMPRFLGELSVVVPGAMHVYMAVRKSSLKLRIREVCKGGAWLFAFLPDRVRTSNYEGFKALLSSQIQKLNETMDANPESFQYLGVDLRKPLLVYMENGLSPELTRLNAQADSLVRVLDVHTPEAAFAQHSLGIAYVLGELCANRSIPGMLISHGTHVPQDNQFAKIEWDEQARTMMNTHFPFVAVQTPWAERFLEKVEGLHSVPIETGPLLITKRITGKPEYKNIRQKLFPNHTDKTIVIQAGTPKCLYASRLWVYETIDEYISNINDLIRSVEQIEGMYLAVRFRPSGMLTTNDLRQLLVKSECYGIYEEGAFENYLLASDLLVSYSSTTIEEALQNEVSVLLYDPEGKYCHIPAETIKEGNGNQVSPIYYAGSKEELFLSLKWVRKNHLEMKVPENILWDPHSYSEKENLSWLADMGVN